MVKSKKDPEIQLAVKKVNWLQYDIYMLNYDLYYKKKVDGEKKEFKICNAPIERILAYETDRLNEETGMYEIEAIHYSTIAGYGGNLMETLFDPEFLKGDIDSCLESLPNILRIWEKRGFIRLEHKEDFIESKILSTGEIKEIMGKETEATKKALEEMKEYRK